ncbi:MAG: zf-HC2 domain-containing protein [Microthrixaceae bacterium]
MACERWLEALSARRDGEEMGVEPAQLEAHLTRCPSCRAFADDDPGRPWTGTVGPAGPPPDLSRRVTRAVAAADRRAALPVSRLILAAMAVVVAASAVPALINGTDAAGMVSHAERHVGAFSLAYAVGLMVVVIRPARARTILPVAAVVAIALALTGLLDTVEGRATIVGESRHIPELVSVVIVWLLGRRLARGAAGEAECDEPPAGTRPDLRPVPRVEESSRRSS